MDGEQDRRAELAKKRSGSFGRVAEAYDRYRPGPPAAVVDWMLPARSATVVDLGAGTGVLTRDLVTRVGRVVAVEPDAQMRSVLSARLPTVEVLDGAGESIPLGDRCVDAVTASSSWHWMDTARTLDEVARVLVPGGSLAAVWTGPDPDGPFLVQARALLASMAEGGSGTGADEPSDQFASEVLDEESRTEVDFAVPTDATWTAPEQSVVIWDVALTADDLIGLLGTFSWIITMPDERRAHVVTEVRRVLDEGLGISGDTTVDVQYRCEAWRTRLR